MYGRSQPLENNYIRPPQNCSIVQPTYPDPPFIGVIYNHKGRLHKVEGLSKADGG